jgi:hypothetical protein
MTKVELQSALDAANAKSIALSDELTNAQALFSNAMAELDVAARARKAVHRINSHPRWPAHKMHAEALAAVRAMEGDAT